MNALFDVSQRAVRVVEELMEAALLFLHAITTRPIWPCEEALLCSREEVALWVCFQTFYFLFEDKSFILRDVPPCTQNTGTLPVMGYTLLPSCFCLCVSRVLCMCFCLRGVVFFVVNHLQVDNTYQQTRHLRRQ